MLRLGVLGCGAIGTFHARLVAQKGDVALAGLCDTDGARAAALATALGTRAWDDPARFLAEAGLDAVVIATPDDRHVEHATLAARAGVAMLIEKPVAPTRAGVEAIAGLAGRAGVPVMAGHVERFEPGSALLVEAVRAGVCGTVSAIAARRQFGAADAPRFAGRSTTARVLLVHDADLVRWLHAAPLESVVALAARGPVHRATGLDDHIVTTVRFSDGAVAVIESGWTLPDSAARPLIAAGWAPSGNNRLELFGTEGMLANDMGLRAAQLSAITGADGFHVAALRHQPEVHGRLVGALRDQLDHFVDRLRDGQPPVAGLDDARRALELVEAAERSLATGAVVRLR
jgi:myo-inositol 2-dehydrogenase/D-chiro-inositol 1-dehydrogenase